MLCTFLLYNVITLNLCRGFLFEHDKSIPKQGKYSYVLELKLILYTFSFKGLEGDEACHSKRNTIIEKIFQLSNDNDIETKTVNDLIGFLIVEVTWFVHFIFY